MADIIGAIQRQLQAIGQQQAGNVFQGSLTPADRYKPSEYKTASPSGQPAYYYSYGPGKPYYKDPGISGGPFSGGTPAGQPALAVPANLYNETYVNGTVQTRGGGFTPEGSYSTGYHGSGEKPWITAESSPGVYKSGSFGSVYSPDLSNPSKVNEYNKYLQSQGLPPIGDPNKVAAEFNRTGKYTPPQNVLSFTLPGYTSYTGERVGTSTATAPSGTTGATTAQAAPTSTLDAIARKLQGGISDFMAGKGPVADVVSNLIRPTSPVYSSTGGETKGEGLLEAIGRKAGEFIAGTGMKFNLPKISEILRTPKFTSLLGPLGVIGGQALAGAMPEQGLGAYLAGRQTPFEEPGLTAPRWGAPGATAESLKTPETMRIEAGLPPTGGLLSEDAMAALLAKAGEEETTGVPLGGGGITTQNPEVGELYQAIVDSINTMGTEQLATVDTSSMDAWYQEALQASGMNEQQAGLETINKQIQVVSDLLDNLDADITEESKNFLMTEAQRRRLVATRGKPLRDELTKLVAGASKYGVNIKNTLAMLEQQINLKKTEAQQRLEAQKAVQASKEARLRGLTALLPYTYPTAGQQLQSETALKEAMLRATGGAEAGEEALRKLAG